MAAADSNRTADGGMMYSGFLPPPQSHKVLIIMCSV